MFFVNFFYLNCLISYLNAWIFILFDEKIEKYYSKFYFFSHSFILNPLNGGFKNLSIFWIQSHSDTKCRYLNILQRWKSFVIVFSYLSLKKKKKKTPIEDTCLLLHNIVYFKYLALYDESWYTNPFTITLPNSIYQ